MSYGSNIRRTLSPENQFRFVCPVFKAETEMSGCTTLHNDFMRGKQHAERRGCQAAMDGNKCPIHRMVGRMYRENDDPYHSAEPRVGQLRKELLNDIAPVVVLESVIDRWGVSGFEREALLAKGVMVELEPVQKPRKAGPKPSAPAEALEAAAAATGDMGAAISKAVELAEKPAQPVREPVSAPKPPETPAAPATPPVAASDVSKPMSLLERARLRGKAA